MLLTTAGLPLPRLGPVSGVSLSTLPFVMRPGVDAALCGELASSLLRQHVKGR
jgi:hypothetical protein